MKNKFDHSHFLKNTPTQPGVYEMFDEKNNLLYVGKARNLKKRVSSYFRKNPTEKIKLLTEQIHTIQLTITHSENEALLLENNLIKRKKPRYNILLRDDKSYPYLYLSSKHDFPRLTLYRGAKTLKGDYFGPYPSSNAAKQTLQLLQRLFKLRQCDDTFFKHRTRPCLQYQIKRCTAPCVKYISKSDYQNDIEFMKLFLQGKSDKLINLLISKMKLASQEKKFEQAVIYRDQIASLRRVQEKQYVHGNQSDTDIIAVLEQSGLVCIQLLSIRDGELLGNKTYFPKVPKFNSESDILAAFISQHYLNPTQSNGLPKYIICEFDLEEKQWLESALIDKANYKIHILHSVRGERAQWLSLAKKNAEQSIKIQLADKAHIRKRYESLQDCLHLPELPNRLECFDISHTMGEATVASCVVFDSQGPKTSDYRRFNIEGITPGDDYAAMHQALLRRYTRLKKGEGALPDILFIDGGKGQLTQAKKVLEDLQIIDVLIVGVAKGPGRKAGLESLFIGDDKNPVNLNPDSPALHLIQHIRDEAHRFAITAHRHKRGKARTESVLENIPGVGPKKRKALLTHLGGLQEVKRASVETLSHVPGINNSLAKRIFDSLHN